MRLTTLFTLLFAAMLWSPKLSAAVCSATLRDEWARPLQHFIGLGPSDYEACRHADGQCQEERWRREARGQHQYSYCDLDSHNPAPTPGTHCRADMVDRSGYLITSFYARGQDLRVACQSAMQSCHYDLRLRQSRGHNVDGFCRIGQGGTPGPRPPMEVRQCDAGFFNHGGQLVQIYRGTAQGPRGTDVYTQACQNAMADCQRHVIGRGSCRILR